jgi:hypothetical protein
MILILLVLAVIGAVVDSKYIKAGGVRSSRSDRYYLIAVISLVGISLTGLGVVLAVTAGKTNLDQIGDAVLTVMTAAGPS